MKRIQRAVNQVERDLRKQKVGRTGWRIGEKPNQTDEMDEVLDNVVYGLGDQQPDGVGTTTAATTTTTQPGDIPDLPRDWKVRLREKVLRNIEATVHDIHIRCEFPGQRTTTTSSSSSTDANTTTNSSSATTTTTTTTPVVDKDSFVIGLTLQSLVVRTASEDWKVGRHDKRGSASCRENDHLGPNEYVVHNNKIGYFSGAAVYFDEDPPILLSESDALKGNCRKMAPEKLHYRISAAMDKLFHSQQVGSDIRESLYLGSLPE
jgi:Vacuolar sorting-associated protein 13, N-terminal